MLQPADIASLIDHALLNPTLDDAGIRRGCELAARLRVASVCVKPYAVADSAAVLAGSGVAVGTVVAFPHGGSSTDVKIYETRKACADGAVEVDFVVNVGKVLGGDWSYVSNEIRAVDEAAVDVGALTKVIFETDFYANDEPIVRLCEICSEVGVAFVKTSTGFGFVRRADGTFEARGATDHHVRLMRAHVRPDIGVKASGGIRTLDDVLRLHSLGATRIGTSSSGSILEAARAAARETPVR
ncbi:MAG TPA: deoxyribose-phosphate aldolase [Rhodothermales bacterium]